MSKSNRCLLQSLIKRCSRVEDLKPLKSLIIVNGLTDYKRLISEFIGQCFDLGTPELAISAFSITRNRSLLLQNLIIRRLCNLGLYHEVLSVYKKFRLSGCPGGDYTFPHVVKACSAVSDVALGREIHGVILRTGYDTNVVIQTAIVDFYAKNGRMDIARLLFDGMSEWDLVSWNALISGYSLNGLDYEVLEVSQDIWVKGIKPNVNTLASIVPICTRLRLLYLGWSLHGCAVKHAFDQDTLLTPALISMYSSDGDICAAECLFVFSSTKNVVIWNSIIYAHTQCQKPKEAFEMFQQMVHADLQPNNVTFVSLIPCCLKMNHVGHGECLHGYVIKYGLDNQVSVMTALISMYSKLGDIDSAVHVFTQMPHRNLLTWNSIISGYVRHGLLHTSLDAVYEMQLAGFAPDSISMINILSACSQLGSLLQGKSAHAISIRKGFSSNVNVLNLLLAFYSNCGELCSSFKLFDRMTQKNSISWNTMISGCVHNSESEKARTFLWGMQQEGVELDIVTLTSILPSCNENGDLAHGMALHGFALKVGCSSDVTLANALINMYCSCNDLVATTLLFNTMTVRCLVSWNSLITGFRCHNLHKEVISFFKQMMEDDQKPNYITLLNVLPACCTMSQGRLIHSYALRTGAMYHTPFLTSLISMYSRFKDITSCFSLFEAGERWNISLWNVMVSVLVEAREAGRALVLFGEFLQTGLQVEYLTILSLVSACTQLNSFSITNSVLGFVIKTGFFSDTAVCNALMDVYAKSGDILMAREVFENMLDKDDITWSVIINGYGLHGDGDAAISLLSEMENSGINPDSITYLHVLSACSHSGLLDQIKMVFNSMLLHGIQPRMEHYACVLDLLGRTGELHKAYGIVKKLPGGPSATVSILESLLGACRVHQNIELGEKVGELLIERDPENSGAYVTLHNIYAGAGRWEQANRIRTVMEERRLRKLSGFSVFEGHAL